MAQYKIHQLIYTKLNPEDSPFGKKDFHTAFYPIGFLSQTDVLIIENHIYIPDINDFRSKQVVFFQKHGNEDYLFVLDIVNLGNEVDLHGRSGIFICHVFMFPEALWQKVSSPNILLELVKEYKYSSRAELLQSKHINKENGDILPIIIDSKKVELVDKAIPKLEGNFEIQLLLCILDIFNKENREQRIIASGSEKDVNILFNKLICFLPNVYKINFGWDTCYDAGRMMDYNKTLVAYHQKAPKGALGSTFISIAGKKIELSKDFKISNEQSPFYKWLAGCSASIQSPSTIEEAFLLSEALVNQEKYDVSDTWNIDCFGRANSGLIDKLFTSKSKGIFKGKLTKELNKSLNSKDKLLFFLDKLESPYLSEVLLKIMIDTRLSESSLKHCFATDYISCNPVLAMIEHLWRTKKFEQDLFDNLTDAQKLQLNSYILKTSFFKKKWYLSIVKRDKVLLDYYIRKYSKPKRIIYHFRKTLNMNEKEILNLGFDIQQIHKVFYFKMANFFGKIFRIFRRKRKAN